MFLNQCEGPGKKILISWLFCILVGLVFFASCAFSETDETQSPVLPRLVKIVKVESISTGGVRSFPGVVQPDYECNLSFRVGGPLEVLDAEVGRHVEKGQLIARIDDRDFLLNIKKLKAALARAGANLKAMKAGARDEDIARMKAGLEAANASKAEAESNYKRYRNLYEQKAVAKASLDTAKTAYENALAGVTSAEKALEIGKAGARDEDVEAMESQLRLLKADLEAAENALKDTELKAPVNGLINRKFVENFETVGPGQPVVSLLDMNTVEVKLYIPQTLVSESGKWKDFSVSLDAFPGVEISGELEEIGRKAEGPGMAYPLLIKLNVPEGLSVLPGMAGDVAIKMPGDEESEVYVPISALFADKSGNPCVWLVNEKEKSLKMTPVITGRAVNRGMIIKKGLKQGDLVVAAGARFLREGEKIRILEENRGGVK